MKRINVLFCIVLLAVACGKNKPKNLEVEKIDTSNIQTIDRLPSADPKGEKKLIDDFTDAFENHQNQFELTSVIITSGRWIVKNDLNGRPISRERISAITATYDGECFVQHFIFKQNADGSDFGDTYINEAYGWKKFNCNLLK